MQLSEFNYVLPEELIAQVPLAERDRSRMLVVNRKSNTIEHRMFVDILDYLRADDTMVFNNTRVVATRLHGCKKTGAKVEALLMKHISSGLWEAMVKPGRRIAVGSRLFFDPDIAAEVVDRTEEGGRILRFDGGADADEEIAKVGQVPLPPYIHKLLNDPERYQTVYAKYNGSAAAPTAGLHFTPAILERIRAKGIKTVFVTLHVGIATFRPVRTENIDDHEMHKESFEINAESAEAINSAKGRIICVGTTTARALESAAVAKGKVTPIKSDTNLFIKPPYEFKIVDGLITNFHMPKSTLLIMISAFAGKELIQRAYKEAVEQKYRFLSFGDATFLY